MNGNGELSTTLDGDGMMALASCLPHADSFAPIYLQTPRCWLMYCLC